MSERATGSTGFKIFKDPVYGYIEIEKDIVEKVIDSPNFQRLRRIVQTSYFPLYSSATHNRFVHSLGVFYLGKIAIGHLIDEIRQIIPNEIQLDDLESLKRIFLMSCLLHDVGHAPFSHTGEVFYSNNGDKVNLNNLLCECIDNKQLKDEKEGSAAPHEIMSAIVGIKCFGDLFKNCEEKEFFARCITGYKYSSDNIESQIKNCMINLLNSNVIDVDKLDYLLRDSFFSGFCSAQIDYQRLLSALTVKYDERIEIAYKKSAISVLENVIYAHDFEKKWIQTHPVVIYDCYLLNVILKKLIDTFDTDECSLFSFQALTEDGIELKNGVHVRLLCDDDVIYLMKKQYDDIPEVGEFFCRNKRKKALWKSETELRSIEYIHVPKGGIKKFGKILEDTEKFQKNIDDYVINKNLLDLLKKELKDIETNTTIDKNSKQSQKRSKEGIILLIEAVLNEAEKEGYHGDFVLRSNASFASSFLKSDFKKIHILFGFNNGKREYVDFGEVGKPLTGFSDEAENKKFFYLFYDRQFPLNKNEIYKAMCNSCNY